MWANSLDNKSHLPAFEERGDASKRWWLAGLALLHRGLSQVVVAEFEHGQDQKTYNDQANKPISKIINDLG
jgi:hypothetical protein